MPRRKHDRSKEVGHERGQPGEAIAGMRIIGGLFRGRKLRYGGDARVRPMKDRVREALFNLLGLSPKGKHVIDLFAGTGALGLEALSRGAARATFIEQHRPTATIVRENIATLAVGEITEVVSANVFFRALWQSRLDMMTPWLVFCSPPYAFFIDRQQETLELVGELIAAAPLDSVFVVESDERFDFALLPQPEAWRIRTYSPAVIGIFRKIAPEPTD